MAIKIVIQEECDTAEGMADVLDRIAELIREGYTSGYYPGWDLQGEEAPLKPEEHHEDCDYRNSHAARETALTFNVDVEENSEVFDCNLNCQRGDH